MAAQRPRQPALAHRLATLGLAGLLSLTASAPCAAQSSARVLTEPQVKRVLEAARRSARADGHVEDRRKLSRRARLSGLLPRVRLGLRHGLQYDLYRDLGFEAGGRSAEDQELTLDASATFELDRLVFAPEQVSLSRLERRLDAAVEKRVREVISLVFLLQRRWLERLDAAAPDPDLDLEIAELEVLLATLTEGAFRKIWRSATQAYLERHGGSRDTP